MAGGDGQSYGQGRGAQHLERGGVGRLLTDLVFPSSAAAANTTITRTIVITCSKDVYRRPP